jgi:hypothetical protein
MSPPAVMSFNLDLFHVVAALLDAAEWISWPTILPVSA